MPADRVERYGYGARLQPCLRAQSAAVGSASHAGSDGKLATESDLSVRAPCMVPPDTQASGGRLVAAAAQIKVMQPEVPVLVVGVSALARAQ